ncbi:MAG: phosphatidylserine decarboxylase, partial [Deltaproteobacteria bacterium]|nr:phosphatidylserine decarboxylase [Deltaproteobacteria bacterium]
MPFAKREDTRINNRLPVAREGLPFITAWSAITCIFLYFGLLFLGIFAGILSLFTIYFFRDPNRDNQVHEKTVLTPADGKILGIQHLKDSNNPLGKPAIKVSIFMSLFNVHVNRIPTVGRIIKIIYNPGKFFSANMDKASEQNENNRIILETSDGREIV